LLAPRGTSVFNSPNAFNRPLALAKRTLDHLQVWEPHSSYLDSCIRPRLGVYHPGTPLGPDSLLLSYQSIRLFPAAPPDAEIVMEHFAAQGGFRVSATRTREGNIQDVCVRSTVGEVCRVTNPWPGRRFAAVTSSGVEAARSRKLGTHLCFPTCRGEEYELRPV